MNPETPAPTRQENAVELSGDMESRWAPDKTDFVLTAGMLDRC